MSRQKNEQPKYKDQGFKVAETTSFFGLSNEQRPLTTREKADINMIGHHTILGDQLNISYHKGSNFRQTKQFTTRR